MSVSDADTRMENALMSAWAAHKEWMGLSVAISFEDFKTGFYYGRVYGLDTALEMKDDQHERTESGNTPAESGVNGANVPRGEG